MKYGYIIHKTKSLWYTCKCMSYESHDHIYKGIRECMFMCMYIVPVVTYIPMYIVPVVTYIPMYIVPVHSYIYTHVHCTST